MIGQNNFTVMFAGRAGGNAGQSSGRDQEKKRGGARRSGQQIARMERELAALQTQVKSVEETYGVDNLHLTVARGYVAKLLANGRVARWLASTGRNISANFRKSPRSTRSLRCRAQRPEKPMGTRTR